jgi:O-antigen/teichoic acid export membrane protein
VFGEEWRQAGVFAAWLSPTFALGFVASPLSYLIFIVNRQGIDLMWQSGLLAIIFSALTFPSTLMSALWTYALGYSLMYVIYLFITYRLSLSGGKGVSVGSAHE